VLVVASDYVGARMAGPGIRSLKLACELGERFDVTLMTPNNEVSDLDGVRTIGPKRGRDARRLMSSFDVVVAQTLEPGLIWYLAGRETRVVYDLYDPLITENLGLFDSEREAIGESAYRLTTVHQLAALAAGDAFICASERQRDLWLGTLAALGRIDLQGYRDSPDLRMLIDVVPFGIEPERPRADRAVLRGVVEGIRQEDRILLWGGGIWNWLDPLTVIRALNEISRERDDVKLVFLGLEHPNPNTAEMTMAGRAVALAGETGLLDRHVFFNRRWVPYGERHNFLLEADIGVSAHFDNAETRYAFRTRLLDYLWADLPAVTTEGDVLGDLVAERGLGRAVAFEHVEGWVKSVLALLDDPGEYQRARANIESTRRELVWPNVVEPLVRLVAADRTGAAPATNLRSMTFEQWRLRVRLSLLRNGPKGAVAHAIRRLTSRAPRQAGSDPESRSPTSRQA
jgi:glycosyltransferase involved in cell wall biosynthesis